MQLLLVADLEDGAGVVVEHKRLGRFFCLPTRPYGTDVGDLLLRNASTDAPPPAEVAEAE